MMPITLAEYFFVDIFFGKFNELLLNSAKMTLVGGRSNTHLSSHIVFMVWHEFHGK